MGIIKRTPADALKDAAAAEAKAAELETQAAEAATTAQQLDAESMTALLENPEQAETITAKISAQERLARAYRLKAAEHREKVPACHREALELEAAELDRQADRLDRDADKLAEKVAAAREALEALDGYAWQREPLAYDVENRPSSWSVDGAAGDKHAEAENVRLKATHNRYWIKHGQVARFIANLRDDNTTVTAMWDNGPRVDPEFHTSDLLAQIASGSVLADVAP